MASAPAGEITLLLERWRDGDQAGFESLLPLVYAELHQIAAGLMRRERSSHTLQATALLHELYVRLVRQQKAPWSDRKHFYVFAAMLMRNIPTDYAQARLSARRGGPNRISLELNEDMAFIGTEDSCILDLDRALTRLEAADARKARLIELRFYFSFTTEEAAEALDIPRATAERDLKFARSWLFRELSGAATPA